MTLDPTQFDIRQWGGVVGAEDNSTANDAAFTAAIAANVPVVYLPGIMSVSTKIAYVDQAVTFVGTSPNSPAAGGLLVHGTGTAQSDCTLEFTDNHFCRCENVRFYGHVDAPTTKVACSVRVQHDSGGSADFKGTGASLVNCVFEDQVKDVKSFTNIVEVTAVTADANTDLFLMDHCFLHGFDGVGVTIDNTQAIQWLLSHVWIDGRGEPYANFATTGLKTHANGALRDSFINRCVTGHQIAALSNVTWQDVGVEHCQKIINCSNKDARLKVYGGKWILSDDAYDGTADTAQRAIDCQNRQTWLIGVDTVNQVVTEVPKLFLASRAPTGDEADIWIDGCTFWEKTHIYDDIGDANQFYLNDNGIRFRFRNDTGTTDAAVAASSQVIP